ncbi:LAGLIDADG family homing endonuclease [Sulfurihydrogenibium sp.]|uniref:LAGLIDADG family homing endonuclease n=1 Tax=Sulfurihydrogenibium sp. TaxID=2053621 RepID=UPI0026127C9D|nr:LAGLIDADG family homing endonuclease [Sulfurihydrogenibium sp.]
MKVEPYKLSYIAGLFDCGGKVSLRKDGRTETSIFVHVTIKAKSSQTLQMIKEIFGGTIRKNKNNAYLIITHRKARNFLKTIREYTYCSQEEIDEILKIYELRFSHQLEASRKKKAIREILKKFKKTKIYHGRNSVRKFIEG